MKGWLNLFDATLVLAAMAVALVVQILLLPIACVSEFGRKLMTHNVVLVDYLHKRLEELCK